MRISDWSSDVCSSDLHAHIIGLRAVHALGGPRHAAKDIAAADDEADFEAAILGFLDLGRHARDRGQGRQGRSEEHTSELQSLMRTSYAVCCLKQKSRSTET